VPKFTPRGDLVLMELSSGFAMKARFLLLFSAQFFAKKIN
jgi:hypothetical protein